MSDQPVHGTALAWRGAGVLLRGASGSGKSDLALRMLDRGWRLVSDDYVMMTEQHGRLFMQPPPAIAGLIEVRGVGLVRRSYSLGCFLHLVADLTQEPVDRLPEPCRTILNGVSIPCIRLNPFEISAPLKLESALTLVRNAL
jgi:HPr kinase/phosphorylase